MAQDPKLHKLDDLFHDAKQYTKSLEYQKMILFCKKMRHLGPYNAMLANFQMPGARFLLTADKWMEQGRTIKYSARPIVILMPFSPVDFVFDLSDTMAIDKPLFQETEDDILERIRNQFNPKHLYNISKLFENLYHNLQLEGIYIENTKRGTEHAGDIRRIDSKHKYSVNIQINKKEGWFETAQAYYCILIKEDLNEMGRLLTTLHELGHLYCHHLSHPDLSAEDAWNERQISKVAKEFEAESVAELVFDHFGYSTDSITREYLAGYLESNENIPTDVSPELVFSAAGKIIQMLEHKMNYRDGLVFKYNKQFSSRIEKIKAKTGKAKEKKSQAAAAQGQTLPFQEP